MHHLARRYFLLLGVQYDIDCFCHTSINTCVVSFTLVHQAQGVCRILWLFPPWITWLLYNSVRVSENKKVFRIEFFTL
jgi:hypothetical protein